MSDERLREIKERAAKATPGPWEVQNDNEGTEYRPFWVIGKEGFEGGDYFMALHIGDYLDAEFIAHARQDVPDLLAEALAQKESKEKAYFQLQQSIIDKAYIMQTLDNILRICETNRDNSDLRKIEEIINESIEELEAKAYERAVHHQQNHVQCSAV